jgi:hypothetical protein
MNDSGFKLTANPGPIQGIVLGSAFATVRLFFSIARGSGAISDLAVGHSRMSGLFSEALGMYASPMLLSRTRRRSHGQGVRCVEPQSESVPKCRESSQIGLIFESGATRG